MERRAGGNGHHGVTRSSLHERFGPRGDAGRLGPDISRGRPRLVHFLLAPTRTWTDWSMIPVWIVGGERWLALTAEQALSAGASAPRSVSGNPMRPSHQLLNDGRPIAGRATGPRGSGG